MAQSLAVVIALEGGKLVEQQLADIGKAGQKAFQEITKAAEQARGLKNLKPEEVTTKLKDMGVVGADAMKKIQAAVASATRTESLVQGVVAAENALAALGRAAGPVGAAIVVAFGAATRAALAWANTVNAASTEAMNLGVGIGELDKLRQGFEKAGISSEAVSDGLRKVKSGLDQLDVGRVKQAFEQLKEAAGRGFGGIGSSAMQALQAAAQGVGKAADDARVALAKLVDDQRLKSLQADVESTAAAVDRARAALARLSQVPEGTPGLAQELRQLRAQVENTTIAADRARAALAGFAPDPAPLTGLAAAFEKLGIKGGELSAVIPQLVEKFRAMPDTAHRTALAFDVLGDKMGPELIAALQTGSAGIDMFTQKWAGMTQAQAIEAAKTQQTLNQLTSEWNRFKADLMAPVAVPLLGFIRSEFEGIKAGVQTTVQEFARLGAFLVSLGNLGVDSFWFKLGEAVVKAAGAVGDFIGKLSGIVWDQISSGGVAAWDAITGAIGNLITKIGELASAAGGAIWEGFKSAGGDAIDWVMGQIDALIEKIKGIASAIGKAFSGGGGEPGSVTPAPGNARGGLIGGRGTGTSDSNLSWVSRGEHIMPARAVRQPGVLAFLEALRRSGGNLRSVLNGMGRFASGGMVSMPAMANAGGGGAMAGRDWGTISLQLPDGTRVRGGVERVVFDALSSAAVTRRMTSTGKKPGFIG